MIHLYRRDLVLWKGWEKEKMQAIQHFYLLQLRFPKLSSQSHLRSQKRPTRKVFVYKIQVNPIHAILKYSNYYDFMDR